MCVQAKVSKDIGMTICKSIVVSFQPCSVAFFLFHRENAKVGSHSRAATPITCYGGPERIKAMKTNII